LFDALVVVSDKVSEKIADNEAFEEFNE